MPKLCPNSGETVCEPQVFTETGAAAPVIAAEAVALVRSLYAIERQAKEISVIERLQRRQQQSVPILGKLHEKFLDWKEQLLPKHPMAEALSYALNQWTALTVFCSGGALLAWVEQYSVLGTQYSAKQEALR